MSEGPDPWLAFFGTVAISFAALIVALITLTRVNRQIGLANQQLGLAKAELVAVQEDLKIAGEMRAMAIRVPDLRFKWQLGVENHEMLAEQFWVRRTHLYIIIQNNGQRVARNIRAELLFPRDSVLQTQGIGTKIVNDIEYVTIEVFDQPGILPINNWVRRPIVVNFFPRFPRLPFLWRIYDDDFAYPAETWGREELVFKLNLG